MSGGNGGSGGGGGVRGDGGAHDVGPWEPQTPGYQEGQTPALSPGLGAPEVAAEAGTEGTAGLWSGTGPPWFWPSGAYCDCIAKGAGGGWKVELGAASGTHLGLRGLPRCHCAA